ncbi:MAG: U32 family peptidase [Gammaproteobacteria bacterium]|nr:U32 family peptidase [Gammaproteobacteria bacterium]
MNTPSLELVCPAGTPAALKDAVDHGADAVYVGFRNETNARNFPGLNFSADELAEGITYAHAKSCKVFVAINTFARAGASHLWHQALFDAERLKVDAVILADLGLLHYCHRTYPNLRKHLSVQASASNVESIRFYQKAFNVKRMVLPRVLTVSEIANIYHKTHAELEVFAFGGLCVMAEGRCALSSYATGKSPNTSGVCSPASHVHYEKQGEKLISKLGEFTINVFESHESAGYPTLCKGRFIANGKPLYLFEEPVSLNTISILDKLKAAGVCAIKIEGRQRGRAYVAEVVRSFRAALDNPEGSLLIPATQLSTISEGQTETVGSYERGWR